MHNYPTFHRPGRHRFLVEGYDLCVCVCVCVRRVREGSVYVFWSVRMYLGEVDVRVCVCVYK